MTPRYTNKPRQTCLHHGNAAVIYKCVIIYLGYILRYCVLSKFPSAKSAHQKRSAWLVRNVGRVSSGKSGSAEFNTYAADDLFYYFCLCQRLKQESARMRRVHPCTCLNAPWNLRKIWICSLHPASIFHNLSFCSSTGLMFPITATLHSVETSLYQRV